MASPLLKEKSSSIMSTSADPPTSHLAPTSAPFDTPKTSLSRTSTTSAAPPARPVPAKLLRLDTAPDLEKGFLSAPHSTSSLPSPLYTPSREYSVPHTFKECSMWPSKATLKSQAKQQKCSRRGSNFFGLSQRWGAMNKKQRLWIRIVLVLLVICLAVGVAIGISRAVGGGVWAGDSKQKSIPGS